MNSVTIQSQARAGRYDGRWTQAIRNWMGYCAPVMVRLRALAPYALIELLLPGGSIMALLLWFYRRRRHGVESSAIVSIPAGKRECFGPWFVRRNEQPRSAC